MSRQEKSSRQPEARPYFMRAFSAVDSPKLEAFYSSLLSPIGPLAAGAPGRAALESQSPGRDHPYTAQVLPHLYMESTGGTSDILRGPKPGTEQADTRGQHTSYASAALAAVLQRQPHETSQSTLSASPGMVVKSLDRTCDHSDTHSAAPPDLPAHLKPIAAARLQGSAFPPGKCGSVEQTVGDNIEALSKEVDSQLSLRGDNCTPCPEPAATRTFRGTQGDGVRKRRDPSGSGFVRGHSKDSIAKAVSKATQQQEVSLGTGAPLGSYAEHPWEQTMGNLQPPDHRTYRQGAPKQVDPLGEVSPNILKCPGDTAVGVQCSRLKSDSQRKPPESYFGSEKRTVYIDNKAFDMSVVTDSDAVRLSSTGSSGSANSSDADGAPKKGPNKDVPCATYRCEDWAPLGASSTGWLLSGGGSAMRTGVAPSKPASHIRVPESRSIGGQASPVPPLPLPPKPSQSTRCSSEAG